MPSPRPEPAQLKAVERLLSAQDYASAIPRIEGLITRFPDHSGLRRLLVEARQLGQGEQFAAVAAYEWARCRPNNLTAQQELLGYALRTRHLMLADQVAAQVRALGGETPGFPLDDETKADCCTTPDGGQAAEQEMIRFDIAHLYMSGLQFEEAAQQLQGLNLLSAKNNRAICLFHLLQIDQAIEAFHEAWQDDAENLLALGWLVLLRLYRGDQDGASGLCVPLAATSPRRADDATMALIVLLLMQRPAEAWQFYQRVIAATWWEGVDQDPGAALIVHLGACAAVQLGQGAEARTLWQQVARAFPKMTPADENLSQSALFGANAAAESVPPPSIIELQNALPAMLLQRMRGGHKQALQVIDRFDASADYLDALYRFGSEQLRQVVQIILVRRLERQDRAAADVLRGIVRLPTGTTEDRYQLLSSLREHGMLGADEEVEIWDGSKLIRIRMFSMEIHREPTDSGLPPHLDERMEQSIIAYTQGRYQEAEADLLAILAARPDHPAALGNLAAIRDGEGNHEEATRLLEQALAANPDYLFGRCSLARQRIFDGDLDAAEALLEGQGQLPRIHAQDFLNLHGTLAMLAAARGDSERARQSLRAIQPVVADPDADADERRRFNDIRRSLISVSKDEAFKQELSREMFMPLFEGRSAGR
ncbi:tetratricopeptide repeat protein [Halochromatium roseum]|uniref:tetratricopeptide repeat protein n=1 Tax=Halochromatium roseum TaxID=391920 RepID=UPI001913E6B3|nr:tetratricopeptide repeat protein [Halochromatium roseum]MBK5938857.1 hypothetical protein [Halochromatium roseum]